MKKFENDVLEFVNESLQIISEQVDLNEKVSLHMIGEVEKVTNLTAVRIQQIANYEFYSV